LEILWLLRVTQKETHPIDLTVVSDEWREWGEVLTMILEMLLVAVRMSVVRGEHALAAMVVSKSGLMRSRIYGQVLLAVRRVVWKGGVG
jgi:hypothetical protein